MAKKDIKDFTLKSVTESTDFLLGVDQGGVGLKTPASRFTNKLDDQSTEWTKVTFNNPNFSHAQSTEYPDGLQYRKNKIGNVEIEGQFNATGSVGGSTPMNIFTLPIDFRPKNRQDIIGYNEVSQSSTTILIGYYNKLVGNVFLQVPTPSDGGTVRISMHSVLFL